VRGAPRARGTHAGARRGGGRRNGGRSGPGAGPHEPRDRRVRGHPQDAVGQGAGMNTRVLIVIGFVAAIGAILYLNVRGKRDGARVPGLSSKKVELQVLYSTEKKDWLEAATAGFQREHPDIVVQLGGKGSLEGAQALLDGKEKPTLWSPADSLVLGLAGADWVTKNGTRLFAAEGAPDAPQPLVITPLVFVVWEDRAEPLLHQQGRL